MEALFNPSADSLHRARSRRNRGVLDPNAVQLPRCCRSNRVVAPEDVPLPAIGGLILPVWKTGKCRRKRGSGSCTHRNNNKRRRTFRTGAAWRELTDEDMESVVEMVKAVRELGIETCATLGMLNDEQTEQLARRWAGLLQPQL